MIFPRKRTPTPNTINLQTENGQFPNSALDPGMAAPDFSLESTAGNKMSLNDLSDQPLILAFYPGDWSPVCGDQLVLYNEVLPLFESFNAKLLGISVDSIWSHRAFAADRNLIFPLLSDFEPKGLVARKYGVYDWKAGTSQRALFVITRNKIIHWSYVSPPDVNPGAEGILNALESLGSQKELSYAS